MDRLLVVFAASAMGFIAFGGFSWLFYKPYKTDSAIAATSILVIGVGIIAIAGWFAIAKLLITLRLFGYGMMMLAALATLNFLVFAAWGQSPYYPVYSAWTIAIAAVFICTHRLMIQGQEEVVIAEKHKMEARTNAVSATSPA